jgi:hypothetical protein
MWILFLSVNKKNWINEWENVELWKSTWGNYVRKILKIEIMNTNESVFWWTLKSRRNNEMKYSFGYLLYDKGTNILRK